MQFLSSKRLFTAFLAVLHLLVSMVAVAPLATWAQVVDTEPPIIDIQAADEGVLGDNQVFTTTVTDNQGVSSVVLHFRFDDNSAYVAQEMQVLSGTDIYTATVETNNVGAGVDSIQYFIEAKDNSGNRTLQGFAFDPLERALIFQNSAVNDSANVNASNDSGSTPAVGMSTRNKVLLGLLGVVVIGALAASSSSSSDGGSSEPGVPLTVNVDPGPVQ